MNSRALLAVSRCHVVSSFLDFFVLRARQILKMGVPDIQFSTIVRPRPNTHTAAAFS